MRPVPLSSARTVVSGRGRGFGRRDFVALGGVLQHLLQLHFEDERARDGARLALVREDGDGRAQAGAVVLLRELRAEGFHARRLPHALFVAQVGRGDLVRLHTRLAVRPADDAEQRRAARLQSGDGLELPAAVLEEGGEVRARGLGQPRLRARRAAAGLVRGRGHRSRRAARRLRVAHVSAQRLRGGHVRQPPLVRAHGARHPPRHARRARIRPRAQQRLDRASSRHVIDNAHHQRGHERADDEDD